MIDGVRLIVPRFRSSPVAVKRSLPPADFAKLALASGVRSAEPFEDLAHGMRQALEARAPVLVTGSLYLVSQVRVLLAQWGAHPAERQ